MRTLVGRGGVVLRGEDESAAEDNEETGARAGAGAEAGAAAGSGFSAAISCCITGVLGPLLTLAADRGVRLPGELGEASDADECSSVGFGVDAAGAAAGAGEEAGDAWPLVATSRAESAAAVAAATAALVDAAVKLAADGAGPGVVGCAEPTPPRTCG